MKDAYEVVIGLEVHVELKTATKIFCNCTTAFGGEPNTHCCPVCLGFPGTLPVLNEKVVDYAIKAGVATHCSITQYGKQDRKNYFYPDLPKAYQISQYDLPLCYEGHLDIVVGEHEKRIGITRIHIEEDAGKLIHDEKGTYIDYNRCGVPLIEIVSEPDLRSADEVKAYLTKLRAILLFADVSDCKMNEGSFRCDVNLSIRKKGELKYGTRTEMKNLNSFAFIAKAIEHETNRQIQLIESGESVVQETRRWDQAKGKSVSMRTKEDAHDYRYFPDPDLMPIVVNDAMLKALTESLPQLPDDRKQHYVKTLKLTPYVAEQMVSSKQISDFFDTCIEDGAEAETLSKLVMNEVMRLMSKEGDDGQILMDTSQMTALVQMIATDAINYSIGKKVLEGIWNSETMPKDYVEANDLAPIKDKTVLVGYADEILQKQPKIIEDYLNGKEKAVQAFIGQMMRMTKGKADPDLASEIFFEKVRALK
ncbi:Asp-tRNA(Asn)/Glu-tRNA(Gln) amidotransferase subunit GatB [Fusibacter paucivorans]|uniref:Aspartyl/glutamyl-tRNA(Asn/Gln) amidotransferase subunit B n=1 Tax=Fusibacter paucivorans TaxID=76009 RepID=A0ABS5PKP2_9FIRM|nr:Asp-tRNA(Asn)/Glu-tRNA(Gln) amidotransferase subunit GatB [Fusibacter paucivorans]MBS7525735.1 Asp-tRNA(Asn)/Glu-tRNA(Gln) amidotransferase subunit GatB [Fusibacter paucivorans]